MPTEAELISLDAGLRMDGIPGLDLWDLMIEVFHSSPNQTKPTNPDIFKSHSETCCTPPNMQGQTPTKHINLDLANVDHVPSNAKPSGSSAMLYVFEDDEAD